MEPSSQPKETSPLRLVREMDRQFLRREQWRTLWGQLREHMRWEGSAFVPHDRHGGEAERS